MLVELPVHLPDPLHRYAAVRRSARAAKQSHTTLGARTIESLAELSVPAVTRRALALYSSFGLASRHRPLSNVTISNVPGPFFELAFDGRKVHAIHPQGPLLEGVGLNITVLSYHESIDVGILSSGRALDHAEELADGIAVGIEQMVKLRDRENDWGRLDPID